jgi:uncharacterized protein Veg
MTDQLISFETAKLAKEKGIHTIDAPYLYRYINDANYNEIFPAPNKSKRASYVYLDIIMNNLHKYEDNDILTPTQSLLQKWLREKYDIHIIVKPVTWTHKPNGGYTVTYTYSLMKVLTDTLKRNENYGIYEEALEIGLQEALKLI